MKRFLKVVSNEEQISCKKFHTRLTNSWTQTYNWDVSVPYLQEYGLRYESLIDFVGNPLEETVDKNVNNVAVTMTPRFSHSSGSHGEMQANSNVRIHPLLRNSQHRNTNQGKNRLVMQCFNFTSHI